MTRTLLRLVAWTESLPEMIRPAVRGALFIVFIMLLRGAWLAAPIAIVFVLATSKTPVADLTLGATVVGLATLGGAVSGLAYGVFGRPLRKHLIGRYLAGVLTAAPYTFVLTLIIRVTDHHPVWRPLSTEDISISGGMAVVFGIVIGHTLLGAPAPTQAVTPAERPSDAAR